jgi:general secretion pathway protein A
LKYIINPLDEEETAKMIIFRLEAAGLPAGRCLFTPEAVRAIHRFTQGYPRKVSMVCHNALEALVMHEREVVEESVVEELISHESRWLEDSLA